MAASLLLCRGPNRQESIQNFACPFLAPCYHIFQSKEFPNITLSPATGRLRMFTGKTAIWSLDKNLSYTSVYGEVSGYQELYGN
jgi:hypothetical protein